VVGANVTAEHCKAAKHLKTAHAAVVPLAAVFERRVIIHAVVAFPSIVFIAFGKAHNAGTCAALRAHVNDFCASRDRHLGWSSSELPLSTLLATWKATRDVEKECLVLLLSSVSPSFDVSCLHIRDAST
jgi:hypothetical protein